MSRNQHFQIGHKKIDDPTRPNITDSYTDWSDEHEAYITTMFGKNEKGERIVKYRARENYPYPWGPD